MTGWRSLVLTGDTVDPFLYVEAMTRRMVVADCHCSGAMRPLPVETVNGVRWFGAICDSCGWELQAPNGKTRRGRKEPKVLATVGAPAPDVFPADLVNSRRSGERDGP